MDWQQFIVSLAVVAVVLGPGFWLWRDVSRHGGNPWIWVLLYAVAVVPPTRLRFVLGPAVFAAWFLLRDREFATIRSAKRAASYLIRKLG